MDTAQESASTAPADPPSHWARALGGDREALRELAESYWYTAYAWWRRSGVEDAETATVASFTRWLADEAPQATDEGAEHMRDWMLARLTALAERGVPPADEPAIGISAAWAEERYAQEPAGTPEHIYSRRWALTILEFATEAVRAEYAARGHDELFAEVAPYANFMSGEEDRYDTTARRLGFTAGAAKKAVFEFRTRHREVLRAFIAATVADPGQIDSELSSLLCACGMPGSAAEDAPLPTAIRQFKPDELLARAMRTVHMTSGGAHPWTPPSDEEAARLFPQYEMLGILGRGGMGAVYKGRQVELDRLVAIKLLPLEVSVDQTFADRFRREARALARLSHPNIVGIHDFGTTTEGHLFFVMEFVDGADLSQRIHGRGGVPAQGLPVPRALDVLVHICDALEYAHGKGMVHRDIKPANIMVGSDGVVKVADFGLARMGDAAGGEDVSRPTVAGLIVGTPDYMAPEQKRGQPVDHRADLYSLGVLLYEMLCKETPQGAFDLPSKRGHDVRFDAIINRALAAQPERRYQSAAELRADLVRLRDVPAPPTGAPAAALGTTLPAVKAAPFLPRSTPKESAHTPKPAPALGQPAPSPFPPRPPSQAQSPTAPARPPKSSRARKPRNWKPLIYLAIFVPLLIAAFVLRHRFARLAAPLPAWARERRERMMRAIPKANTNSRAEAWVSLLSDPSKIKSGNYVQGPKGIIPAPGQMLLIDPGASVRDGAIRVRLSRAASGGLRVFVRVGPGDYSAVVWPDKVVIHGGPHSTAYKELRAFPLRPFVPGQLDEIELELRVVGAKITIKADGAELGSLEDSSVSGGGAFGVGTFRPEKTSIPIKSIEYLVLD